MSRAEPELVLVLVLATEEGRTAAQGLLVMAREWQEEARRRVRALGELEIENPAFGPWKAEGRWPGYRGKRRRKRTRFVRAAHNYAWAGTKRLRPGSF